MTAGRNGLGDPLTAQCGHGDQTVCVYCRPRFFSPEIRRRAGLGTGNCEVPGCTGYVWTQWNRRCWAHYLEDSR